MLLQTDFELRTMVYHPVVKPIIQGDHYSFNLGKKSLNMHILAQIIILKTLFFVKTTQICADYRKH